MSAPLATGGHGHGHCPCCHRPIPLRGGRHGLTVESEPWRIFWRGLPVAPVRAMEARFLFALLQRGEVATGSLERLIGENSSARSIHVQVCRLRGRLRADRIPFEIQNIHGWGYRLKFTGDA